MLKPCCLPGRRNLFAPANGKTVPIVYTFPNGHAFRPLDLDLCSDINGDEVVRAQNDGDREVVADNVESVASVDGSSSASIIPRPHEDKNCTNERFSSKWIEHLYLGCCSENYNARIEVVDTQLHHFQNQFIFSERTLQ